MSLKHHKFRAAKAARAAAPAITPDQLAHELNNLLDGSLRGVGMTLRRLDDLPVDEDTRDKLKKYLGTADHSMRKMADVIDRFANQPNHNNGGSLNHLLQAPGTMLDALTHAVNVYGPAIEQRGIELVTRLDPEVGDLPAGPMYTVLANAINNALQAIERADTTPSDATPHRIAIRLINDPQCPEHFRVEITDTGVGLDPRLIDPDGRFRFGVTTRPQGHGVGLGVCRQIAEDLGGELGIESQTDRGARFWMTCPSLISPAAAFGPDVETRRAG